MKPSEVHALRSARIEPWYDAGTNVLRSAFGVESYDFDDEAARATGNSPLLVHEKLSCPIDGGRHYASIHTLEFEGRPFGIHCVAGKSDDHDVFYVSDREAFEAALAHLSKWRKVPDGFVDATKDDDVPDIGSFYGAVVVAVGDDVRFVTADRVGEAGDLVFDDVRHRVAFDRILRPAYAGKDSSIGFKDAGMRALAAEAIVEGIPTGLDSVLVDRHAKDDPGVFDGHWIGAVASTGEGTYAIVIPGWQQGGYFSWVHGIGVQRIGGPEAIDAYRASSPRP